MGAQLPLAYSPYLQTGLMSPLLDGGVVTHPAPAQPQHSAPQQVVKRNEVGTHSVATVDQVEILVVLVATTAADITVIYRSTFKQKTISIFLNKIVFFYYTETCFLLKGLF